MAHAIDAAIVQKVARLARLRLTEAEQARFCTQLTAIIEYVEILGRLDTADVPPTAHPLDLLSVLRADEPRAAAEAPAILANAPQSQAGHFTLPKVLDQESA